MCDSAFADLSTAMENGLTSITHLPGRLVLPAMQCARAFDVLPTLSPVDVVRSLPGRAFSSCAPATGGARYTRAC